MSTIESKLELIQNEIVSGTGGQTVRRQLNRIRKRIEDQLQRLNKEIDTALNAYLEVQGHFYDARNAPAWMFETDNHYEKDEEDNDRLYLKVRLQDVRAIFQPFACHRCSKRFYRSGNLKKHLRTHDKDN